MTSSGASASEGSREWRRGNSPAGVMLWSLGGGATGTALAAGVAWLALVAGRQPPSLAVVASLGAAVGLLGGGLVGGLVLRRHVWTVSRVGISESVFGIEIARIPTDELRGARVITARLGPLSWSDVELSIRRDGRTLHVLMPMPDRPEQLRDAILDLVDGADGGRSDVDAGTRVGPKRHGRR